MVNLAIAFAAVALLAQPLLLQAQSLADVTRAEAARRSGMANRTDTYKIIQGDRVADSRPVRPALNNAEENAVPAPTPPPPAVVGWNSFTLPKTLDEIAADLQLEGRDERVKASNRPRAVLPPMRQAMRTAIGLGYVQGADWAADINSAGKVLGVNADVTSFVTMGRQGAHIRSGRLSLVDPELGWGVEAGQLFTDLRGLAKGVRGSWRFSNHQSTLSFYTRDNRHGSTVSYRDEVRLSHHALVGGEVASDGSLFARGQTFFRKIGVDTYFRKQSGKDATQDRGVSAAYDVWRGITLRGSLRLSAAQAATVDSTDFRVLAVRVPFSRGVDLTFERNWLSGDRSDGSGSAVIFHVPAGPLRIFQRYQWGELAYKLRELPVGYNQRQMQTVASYRAARWVTLNYQVSTEWFEDGRARQWDELRSSFMLARKTNLDVITAMPDVMESSRFRFRVSHQLQNQLMLVAEYGRMSAFRQGPELASERPRFLLSVRKEWNVPTPARGGELSGSVREPNGDPVPGAIVRLGPYGEVTDRAGNYTFENIPTGSFDFWLDHETLPADYAHDGAREKIAFARSTRAMRNIVVVPLGSLTGRVYCDENRNGRIDPGEELSGIVMRLNGGATVSDRSGQYGFYNLAPGPYVVEIDGQRLPQGFAAKNATVRVQLEPERAATGLDFVLIKVDKPVLLKELP
jgi:protocatechuate 3,4-dioxygenase beta subunit